MPQSFRNDVFLARNSVEEIEVDDVELLQLLDQFDDVAFGETDEGFGLLSELELPLQLQQFIVHGFLAGIEASFSLDKDDDAGSPIENFSPTQNYTRRRAPALLLLLLLVPSAVVSV